MAERIRFHLDEHIHPKVARALRDRGADVTTTNEVGLRTSDDGSQLTFAIRERRAFVTGDLRLLAQLATIGDHAGVIVVLRSKTSISEQIRGLLLIYDVLTDDDMRNHVEYVS